MTEYAWPETIRPSRLVFYLQHNTLRFTSPVTRSTQVLRREGARWIAEATFDPLDRVRAGVLEGLLAALAGSANTVRIWHWRREFRSGDPRSQGQVPVGPYSFDDATIFTDGTGMVVGSGNPSLAAGAARGAGPADPRLVPEHPRHGRRRPLRAERATQHGHGGGAPGLRRRGGQPDPARPLHRHHRPHGGGAVVEGIRATPRLSPQAAAGATAKVAAPVVLAELDFASGPFRGWTGLGPRTPKPRGALGL
jgi:hypothetical protein